MIFFSVVTDSCVLGLHSCTSPILKGYGDANVFFFRDNVVILLRLLLNFYTQYDFFFIFFCRCISESDVLIFVLLIIKERSL